MFATKLQGASLFLLICRDLQGSVSLQEERTRAGDALCVTVSVPDCHPDQSSLGCAPCVERVIQRHLSLELFEVAICVQASEAHRNRLQTRRLGRPGVRISR